MMKTPCGASQTPSRAGRILPEGGELRGLGFALGLKVGWLKADYSLRDTSTLAVWAGLAIPWLALHAHSWRISMSLRSPALLGGRDDGARAIHKVTMPKGCRTLNSVLTLRSSGTARNAAQPA